MNDELHPNLNDNAYTNRELWLIINNNNEQNKIMNDQNSKEHQALYDNLQAFHLKNGNSLMEITEKLDKALEKKANVWVETFLIWLGAGIGMGLLSYLGYLIIKLIDIK